MKSVTTRRFRASLQALPVEVQLRAKTAYRLWLANPSHRSLDYKQAHPSRPIMSVRIGLHWRAIGVRKDDAVVWTWIGSHSDYDKLLGRV